MNVVFDFAGVVFHWDPPSMLARELPERASTPETAQRLADEIFQNYAGDWLEFDRGTIEVQPLVERIARRTGLTHHEVRRAVDAVPHELQPVPATVELMRRVKQAGHRLYYLSNMPAPYADHLERSNSFFEWFDGGVFSSRVRLVKPEAAIFHHALALFDAEPSQTLFFDDHPANVEAARAVGIHSQLYTGAAQAQAKLVELGLLPLQLGG